MRKAQIGAVFTAREAGADIFLQLIGRNSVIGDIARICRANDLSRNICAQLSTLFVIGFPFGVAIKDGYLEYRENCPVPDELEIMKFRFPNIDPRDKIVSWTILTDDGQQIVTTLDKEQLRYPLAYAVNFSKLEELIASGWNGNDLI